MSRIIYCRHKIREQVNYCANHSLSPWFAIGVAEAQLKGGISVGLWAVLAMSHCI